jgi:hypothetical protein
MPHPFSPHSGPIQCTTRPSLYLPIHTALDKVKPTAPNALEKPSPPAEYAPRRFPRHSPLPRLPLFRRTPCQLILPPPLSHRRPPAHRAPPAVSWRSVALPLGRGHAVFRKKMALTRLSSVCQRQRIREGTVPRKPTGGWLSRRAVVVSWRKACLD